MTSVSEKRIESLMTPLLLSMGYNEQYIYYQPSENKLLKQLFQNASKKQKGKSGFPDLIYYKENQQLIVFEFKNDQTKHKQAEKEVLHYLNNIQNIEYEYYGIAISGLELQHTIYNKKQEKLEFESLNINNLYQEQNINENNLDIMKLQSICSKIHKYLRKEIHLSDSEKPFFIAIILVALNKPEFIQLLNSGNNVNQFILSCVENNIKEQTVIQHCAFIKTHNGIKDNNKLNDICNYIYNQIIKYKENITEDVLTQFYTEFVKYNSTDGKALGIVLTPQYIRKLMIEISFLNSNDIMIDLCAGTGGFMIDSLKLNIKKVIGIEMSTKLYGLLYINRILLNFPQDKFKIYNDNSITFDYKQIQNQEQITKSIINPPYGISGDQEELKFIMKQLDLLQIGGLATAIIPVSCLIKNPEYKKQILQQSKVKIILNLTKEDIFIDASVQVVILQLEKTIPNNYEENIKHKTLFIDFSNDGMVKVKNNGRQDLNGHFNTNLKQLIVDIKNQSENEYMQYHSLTENIDWNYHTFSNGQKQFTIHQYDLNSVYSKMNQIKLQQNQLNKQVVYNLSQKYKIKDLFENFLKGRVKNGMIQINGTIPLISAKKIDNGICGYLVDDKKLLKHKNSFSVATQGNGGAGYCFYHPYTFCSTSMIITFQLKEKFKFDEYQKCLIALIITQDFTKKFSYGRTLQLQNIQEMEINIPENLNNIKM